MWRASRKRQRNPCSEVARRFALRTLVQLCMVLSFNRGQPNPVHFRSPRLGLGQRRHLAAGERLALQGLLLRRACFPRRLLVVGQSIQRSHLVWRLLLSFLDCCFIPSIDDKLFSYHFCHVRYDTLLSYSSEIALYYDQFIFIPVNPLHIFL